MVTTKVAPASRLPSAPHGSGSRLGEFLRGLVSLVVLAALVVGVPIALYRGFGTPWPDEAPVGGWLYASIDAETVLSVLVAVVWLAWAHFVVCVLVEIVAERRGRGLSPAVPGGGVGTQPLARRLVSAVLLMAGGAIAVLPAASAVTGASSPSAQSAHSSSAHSAISRMSALIAGEVEAQTHSGIGNSGTDSHGERAFVQQTNNGVHKFSVVQPPNNRNYDCLWDIAERYLGSGLRYKEIFELNRDVVQPDGRKLTNPDLIQPGWILRLPHDAEGPGLQVHEPTEHGSGQLAPVDPAPTPPGPADQGEQAPGTGAGGERDHAADQQSSLAAVAGFAVGGALLAAGLLIGLRRRRGWDGGPDPRGGKKLDDEFELRGTADEPAAVFLDRAIRLSSQFVKTGSGMPPPTTCALGSDGVAFTFARETQVQMDPPWTSAASGRTWALRRADASDLAVNPAALSPYPGLAPLGRRDDGVETLLDVESVGGLVSISGDIDVAREVAVALAVGLATAPWSDQSRVTLVGFADELSALGSNAVRHVHDLEEALEALDARRRRQHAACAGQGFESVRAGRVALPDARLWAPDFLVLSGIPGAGDVDRLAALAADPRNAVGVIVLGDVPSAAVRLVASTEGRLWSGPLGIDVRAHRLEIATYRDALGIFDAEEIRGDPDALVTDVPIVDPDALDAANEMPVDVRVLGPVAVSAPGPVDDERRALLTELVTFLTLHPGGVHPNVLAAAIWPRGVEDEVRDSALAQAAQWLGVDDHNEPRLRVNDVGHWQLTRSGVRVDWDAFRALANRAATSDRALDDFEHALAFVRSQAWAELPAGRYGWLVYESIEADMRVGVVAVARFAAQRAVDAGQPLRARQALLAALRMVPACEPVWRDALRLANQFAGPDDVTAVADDMYAAIARYGSPLGPESETDAVVDDLIPGYRQSAA